MVPECSFTVQAQIASTFPIVQMTLFFLLWFVSFFQATWLGDRVSSFSLKGVIEFGHAQISKVLLQTKKQVCKTKIYGIPLTQ